MILCILHESYVSVLEALGKESDDVLCRRLREDVENPTAILGRNLKVFQRLRGGCRTLVVLSCCATFVISSGEVPAAGDSAQLYLRRRLVNRLRCI